MFYVMRDGRYLTSGGWTADYDLRWVWTEIKHAAVLAREYNGKVCVGDVHGVSFGKGGNFGDISIGDVAGGSITKFGR